MRNLNDCFEWQLDSDPTQLETLAQVIEDEDEGQRLGVSVTKEKFEKDVSYLKQQMEFYSKVLMSRNYLWKLNLSKIFPQDFVFN